MEFQNANNMEDERINNGNKKMYECDCGCGLTFIKGHGLGFWLKTEAEDNIYEDKLDGKSWKEYISEQHIKTWGEFMSLIENSARDQPNVRVWYHLECYLQNIRLVADDMPLGFEYIN